MINKPSKADTEAAKAGTVDRRGGICLLTGTPMPFTYIRQEGKAGRMSVRLMAIVAEGTKARIYLPPNDEHIKVALVFAARRTRAWNRACQTTPATLRRRTTACRNGKIYSLPDNSWR